MDKGFENRVDTRRSPNVQTIIQNSNEDWEKEQNPTRMRALKTKYIRTKSGEIETTNPIILDFSYSTFPARHHYSSIQPNV